jgi:hypothetical protein
MPESLTRRKTAANPHQGGRLQIGMVAGFISERWPASNRNPGRLHVGKPGRNKSESADARQKPCKPQLTHVNVIPHLPEARIDFVGMWRVSYTLSCGYNCCIRDK